MKTLSWVQGANAKDASIKIPFLLKMGRKAPKAYIKKATLMPLRVFSEHVDWKMYLVGRRA